MHQFVSGQEVNIYDRLNILIGQGCDVSYNCKIYYFDQVDSDIATDSIRFFVLKYGDLLMVEGEEFTYLNDGNKMLMVNKMLEIIHLQKAPESKVPHSLLPFGNEMEFESNCSVCSNGKGYKVSCFSPQDVNITVDIRLNSNGTPLGFTSTMYNPESPFKDDLVLVKGSYYNFFAGDEFYLKNNNVPSVNDFIEYSGDTVVPTYSYKNFEVFLLN